MREIKFRVWDKEHKRMLNIETLALRFSPKGVLTSIYTYGPDFSNDPEIIGDDEPDLDSVILEQFTGLDDINGKPIYEGDIVQVYRDWIDIVEFRNGSFGLAASMNHSFISFNNLNGEAEVIGNVHDNPELLEDKK